MRQSLLDELCARYELGRPPAAPTVVAGGLLHRMFRVTTTQGNFAVKLLNPHILRKPGIHERYRETECIAAMAAAAGLPAVAALEAPGGTVQEIEDETVIVTPWLEGKPLLPGEVTPSQAHLIGSLLGRLHALNLPFSTPPGTPVSAPTDRWTLLTAKARQAAWSERLESALPDLNRRQALADEAGAALNGVQVVSHCDLDPKNVLWSDAHTPWLIDWETAGWINPTLEAVGAALNWSGQTTGQSDRTRFTALIQGYREQSAFDSNSACYALRGCLGVWLDWLDFNARRALGEFDSPADERALAVSEIAPTLAILRSLEDNLETWAGWCGKETPQE